MRVLLDENIPQEVFAAETWCRLGHDHRIQGALLRVTGVAMLSRSGPHDSHLLRGRCSS